jgi:hypothetical protein
MPSGCASGNSSSARSGETISSGTPTLSAIPRTCSNCCRRAFVVPMRTLPHWWKSTGRPVSASSEPYSSTEVLSSRMML